MAITIDGRKEWLLQLLGDECLDTVEVLQVPGTPSVPCNTHVRSVDEEWTQLVSILVFGWRGPNAGV